MKWNLIEYEAEKRVPRRQKIADAACCLCVLIGVFWGVPWIAALILTSKIFK